MILGFKKSEFQNLFLIKNDNAYEFKIIRTIIKTEITL